MINLLFKLSAIAFLVIGSSFIGSTAKAETESESSAGIASETTKNTEDGEAQPGMRITAGDEFGETITPQRSIDFVDAPNSPAPGIEVNPSAQQWEDINTGDSSRGTIKFKIE